jgi:hypothetical protein
VAQVDDDSGAHRQRAALHTMLHGMSGAPSARGEEQRGKWVFPSRRSLTGRSSTRRRSWPRGLSGGQSATGRGGMGTERMVIEAMELTGALSYSASGG